MKGGLCIVYTSLLTILVLPICALFIVVVAEALQVDTGTNITDPSVSLDGLQNVSAKGSPLLDSSSELPEAQKFKAKNPKSSILQDSEVIFTDTLSLNSVTTDGLPDAGQPPILISLADSAKLDLKQADDLLFSNDSEHNDTKTFVLVEGKGDMEKETTEKMAAEKEVGSEQSTEAKLVFQAKPMQEPRQAEDIVASTPAPVVPEPEKNDESQIEQTKQNESSTEKTASKTETPQEDIPSFSEWAQKQLAEAEKQDTVLNHSSQPSHSNTNVNNKNIKLRSKNYASPACGAKIVAVNPEAGSASSILSPNRDEYMLNTCNSRIWFIVELCEAVQAQKIELANFELFSSTPKDFAVYFSDRYPTRDWASVGQFTAKDLRDVQSYDLFPHMFGKFIKVEMLSHHGSEHYCPISLFKVYGTSEFEVLEKENAQHVAPPEDDDEIIDVPDIPTAETEASKNLFGSARDAVMSIMKKAAQALVKTEVPKNVSSYHNDTATDNMYKRCCSPSHIIVCDNCSQAMYNEVHELLSCSSDKLTNLIRQVFVRDTLKCTGICQPFGLDFNKSTKAISFRNERVAYMKALFSEKYIAALCNILAIKEKKVVLNTSFETEHNVTANVTLDKPFNITNDSSVEQSIKLSTQNGTFEQDNKTTAVSDMENKTTIPEKTNDSVTKIDDKEIPNEDKEKHEPKEPKHESTPLTNDKPSQEQIELNGLIKETPAAKETTQEVKKDDKGKSDQDTTYKNDIRNVKIESPEKPQKEGGSTTEESEQILIDNDSFMSDFDQLTVDPTPPGTQPAQNNQAQTIQKESVFLRLSNRVKTLERNMSLSGQYLEELSRRYKKQVEEMQKSFEKTVLQMTEERRKSNEREQMYLEQMTNLQQQLTQMAAAMTTLMEDRDSWFGNVTFFKFVVLQALIVAGVFYYIRKRNAPEPILVPVRKSVKNKRNQDKLRRKSVEGVSGHETPSAKKRRPSEEALQIARQSTEEHEPDEDSGEWQIARKNRKRKTSILHRNLEMEPKPSWTRQDSIGQLRETPIPLDEEEFIAPVSEPTEFNKKDPYIRELPKTNGSIFTNLKAKTKSRRLSSPAFLRTLSRQSSRSNPSPVVRPLEPIFNGNATKKASSESPTGSLWSECTEASQTNGQCDSETVSAKKNKRKSFKNIFKKVF